MVVDPFGTFMSRFLNFASFAVVSGSILGATDAVGYRGELFHCPSEGFYPDLADCKIFYRCVDWNANSFRESSGPSLTAFQFTCAEGTVFDPDLNVCNHPRDTSRAECGGRKAPLRNLYPYAQFSPRDNGGGYFGGGRAFPPANESAYAPRQFQNGNAYADEYPYRREDNNKYPWQIDDYRYPVTDAARASGICQSEGFFPVEGDCAKFMRCVADGTGRYATYTFQCGPGTVWDQKNLVCNHPYAVPGCGGTQGYNGQAMMSPESDYNYDSMWMQPERENKNGYNGGSGYGGIPVKGTYPGVENQEGRPPVKGYPELGNYPYQGDQRIYPQQQLQPYGPDSTGQGWNANNFQPANYPAMNPEQTHKGNMPYHTTYSQAQFQGKYSQAEYYFTGENFDSYPGQNEYQYGPVSPVPVQYTTTNNGTNQRAPLNRPNEFPYSVDQNNYPNQGTYVGNNGYPNRPKPTAEEPGVLNGDSKECYKDGFFSIPKECKKFFRCVDNGKGGYFRYDFNCGEGTVWDQESTTCNHPWAVRREDVDCSAEGSASEAETNPNYSTPTYQSETSDKGTWSQTSSQTTVSQAASSYATASGTKDREKTPQSQATQTTPYQESQYNKSTTVDQKTTSHTTPNKDGTTTPMTLPAYTMPDNKRTSEIHPEYMYGNGTTDGSDETSTSLPKSTPFEPNKKGEVKCEKGGFYPYPGSCRKFYRCVDWDGDKGERFSVYYSECAPGTIWDPALNICNHEESVYPPRNCEGDESPEEKRPFTTEGGTFAASESTEHTRTSGFTTTASSSENKTSDENTTSTDIDTTTYTTEEGRSTTSTESSTLASTSTTEGETTTISSTDESGSTTTATEFTTTTVYDNETTTEHTTPGTTMMTTTEQSETSYTSNKQTQTTFMSTRDNKFTPSLTTEATSDASTTMEPGSTDSEQDGNSTTENPSDRNPTTEGSSPDCPVLEDDQVSFVCPTGFRRHPKECNNFYQCTISKEGEVNIMVLTCKNNTVYDERKIQCLPEDETESCPTKASGRSRHYRRTEREEMSVFPVPSSQPLCPEQGNFPYHGDCQKFFKCRADRKGRLQGFLYRCPENFSFWEVSRKCELSIKLPKCSRFPQDISPSKLKWLSSKVPVAFLGSGVR